MPDSSIENKKIFDPSNIKIITIGRDKNSTFSFPKDKSISRNQTSFYFDDEKKEWTIIDGNKNKSSTNGTWVFCSHFKSIAIFQATLIQSSDVHDYLELT